MTTAFKMELVGISKSFPGVRALDDVHLAVRPAAVHVLCGENGAGKSTLMKIVVGICGPDRGEIRLDGAPVSILNPRHARSCGIAMIPQELAYVPEMTLGENLFAGNWPINRWGKIAWGEIWRRSAQLLQAEGLPYSAKTRMKELSLAGRQMIEIVKAISSKASVLLMDEPTSAISEKEVQFLFGKIRQLQQKGVSIIYISHKMDEIGQIADDISVLRDGRLIATRNKNSFMRQGALATEEIITMMVGRELADEFPPPIPKIPKAPEATGATGIAGKTRLKSVPPARENILEVRGLGRKGYFVDIHFGLGRGEILGFAGLMGAGRSEVARAVFGLDACDSGQIYKSGMEIQRPSVAASIRNGIAMLSEDRRRYGIIPVRNIRENATLASLRQVFYRGYWHKRREQRNTAALCQQMKVRAANYEVPVSTLSGGNQQKVVLAKWMLNDPDILIMDEPTRGIDVAAKYEIYQLMRRFVHQGKAILLISSELPEIIGMCDRCYVLSGGRISGELGRSEFSQEKIMALATGLA